MDKKTLAWQKYRKTEKEVDREYDRIVTEAAKVHRDKIEKAKEEYEKEVK